MENKSGDTHDTQQCPICSAPVEPSPRYPTYICGTCVDRAVDDKGRRVRFYNIDAGGGVQMLFPDNPRMVARAAKAPDYQLICYIDGKKCMATEAKMGGVVICPVNE